MKMYDVYVNGKFKERNGNFTTASTTAKKYEQCGKITTIKEVVIEVER